MTATTSSDRARAAAGMAAQPGKELTPFDRARDARIAVVKQMIPAFADALRDEATAKRLARDAITAIRTVPKLVECTQPSFLGALMTAAQLDLRPNVGALGHGWVLPYENKKERTVEAQWITGYQGMVVLGARSGVSIIARTIYSNEDFDIEFGLDERLHHRPILNKAKRGDPLFHYAIARSTTGRAWVIIGDDEAQESRDASPGYRFGGPQNPWRAHYLPMARKTAVRRLWAFVPTDSPELAMGIVADEKVSNYDINSKEHTDAETGEEPASYTLSRADEPRTVEHEPQTGKPAAKSRRKTKTQQPAQTTQRDQIPASPARQALATRLMETHGEHVEAALKVVLHGASVPVDYVTDEELQAAIDLTPEQIADWQQDQAFAKDGE